MCLTRTTTPSLVFGDPSVFGRTLIFKNLSRDLIFGYLPKRHHEEFKRAKMGHAGLKNIYIYIYIYCFLKRFFKFIFRGRVREREREGENHRVWLPLAHPQLGADPVTPRFTGTDSMH